MAARFFKDESGGTAVEYALIASLVVVVLAAALTRYADSLNGMYEYVQDAFVGAVTNSQ